MDEQITSHETARLMNILPHFIAQGSRPFTSRADLMVPAKLLERLGLAGLVDRLMPEPGSNRGYRNGIVFDTFMPAFHEGGTTYHLATPKTDFFHLSFPC